jgi:hypothetical protein
MKMGTGKSRVYLVPAGLAGRPAPLWLAVRIPKYHYGQATFLRVETEAIESFPCF